MSCLEGIQEGLLALLFLLDQTQIFILMCFHHDALVRQRQIPFYQILGLGLKQPHLLLFFLKECFLCFHLVLQLWNYSGQELTLDRIFPAGLELRCGIKLQHHMLFDFQSLYVYYIITESHLVDFFLVVLVDIDVWQSNFFNWYYMWIFLVHILLTLGFWFLGLHRLIFADDLQFFYLCLLYGIFAEFLIMCLLLVSSGARTWDQRLHEIHVLIRQELTQLILVEDWSSSCRLLSAFSLSPSRRHHLTSVHRPPLLREAQLWRDLDILKLLWKRCVRHFSLVAPLNLPFQQAYGVSLRSEILKSIILFRDLPQFVTVFIFDSKAWGIGFCHIPDAGAASFEILVRLPLRLIWIDCRDGVKWRIALGRVTTLLNSKYVFR